MFRLPFLYNIAVIYVTIRVNFCVHTDAHKYKYYSGIIYMFVY